MLRKIEWAVALVTMLLIAWLHLDFFRHAGGLWRDEVGTVNLATRPDLAAVWSHLFFDSFPAFWVLVVRVWIALGGGGDGGLRVLGLLVGLSVLAALWFSARRLRIGIPFFSLLLLALSPTIIIWGDSIRAWGWGVLWIVLAFGLIWRVVESPSRNRIVVAVLAAIASVHSTYYNSVLLFALCVGGAVVAARNRQWKRGALVLAIGGVAALTIIPYLVGIHRIEGHYLITQMPYDFARFRAKLEEAILAGGLSAGYVWLGLVVGALIAGIVLQFRPDSLKVTPVQQDLLLFAVITLIVGSAGYFLFLKNLKFGTQPWYYAALMAVAALAVDAILSVLGNWERGRQLRLLVLVVGLGLMVPPVWGVTATRMTNLDLIALKLRESAGKQDLIVVNPWYCGISFEYYYPRAAGTHWTTLPAIQDHSYHWYEPVMSLMAQSDQPGVIRGVLDQIRDTLKSGHRVWLVGGLTFLAPGEALPTLPAAPHGPDGWLSTPYQKLWSAEAGQFVQAHVVHYQDFIVAPAEGRVSGAEYMPLAVVDGWKDN